MLRIRRLPKKNYKSTPDYGYSDYDDYEYSDYNTKYQQEEDKRYKRKPDLNIQKQENKVYNREKLYSRPKQAANLKQYRKTTTRYPIVNRIRQQPVQQGRPTTERPTRWMNALRNRGRPARKPEVSSNTVNPVTKR